MVTILIIAGLVDVKTGSLSVFVVAPHLTAPKVTTLFHYLLAASCAYLAVTYFFSLAQDRKRFAYMTSRDRSFLAKAIEQITGQQEELAARRSRAMQRLQQSLECQQALNEIDERYWPALRHLYEREATLTERFISLIAARTEAEEMEASVDIQKLKERLAAMDVVSKKRDEIENERNTLQKQRTDERRPYEEQLALIHQVMDDDELLNEHLQTSQMVTALHTTVQDVTNLRRRQFLFDAIIPGTFSLLAIWIVFANG
jgi:hypothetical protein